MASLSQKAGFLILANLVKYAIGFVMPMVLVRFLSKDDYGSYQQLLLVNAIALGIMSFGLPSSIYYYFHKLEGAKRWLFTKQTLMLMGLCGLVSALVIVVGSPLIVARMQNPGIERLLQLYAIVVGTFLASEHFVHFMVAHDRYRTAVGIEVGESIVRVVVMVLPLWLGYGLYGLVLAMTAYSIVRIAGRTYMVAHSVKGGAHYGRQPWDWSLIKEQWAYSFPIGLTSVVGLVGGYLDRAIVAASFTPAHYAIYSVGALEIPLDAIFQSSVANVLRASLPKLVADKNFDEICRLLREAVRKLAIIVIPSFVFLAGHSQLFITTLFTHQYAESVHVFRIYLGLLPLHMFILSPIPQVFGKTRLNFYVAMTAVSSHVVLSFVLLHYVGFYGPAISATVSAYIASGLFFITALKLLECSPAKMLPLAAMARTTAAALLALGLSWLTLKWVDAGLLRLVFTGAVFSIGFVVFGLALGVANEQDRRVAQRWVARFTGGK